MNVLALRSAMIQRKISLNEIDSSNPLISFSKQIETDINVKFIILTEHISFIPNNILNKCKIQSFKTPSNEKIILGFGVQKTGFDKEKVNKIISNFNDIKNTTKITSNLKTMPHN